MLSRRDMLRVTAGAALAAPAALRGAAKAESAGPVLRPDLPSGLGNVAVFDTLPGKKPLIKLSYRPPNYESPKEYFDTLFTPNDKFFVRYHLAGLPEMSALEKWRLTVGGDGAEGTLNLNLDDLKHTFEAVEISAVCQCSGNRRGLSSPHVPGVQWGDGAMGNAKWKGVRLKDVLAKVNVKKDAVEVTMAGADGPVIDTTPKFIKSLPLWKAMDENVLLAYEMNGAPLPLYNGFPVRIIVPGWTGTYWMKHVTSLQLVTTPLDNFWMRVAYRIPQGKFPQIERITGQENAQTMPITNLTDGQKLPHGKPIEVKGIAWDGGYGITGVEVSPDGGATWLPAVLGEDAGRFSFRQWSWHLPTTKPGTYTILAKAINRAGQSQPNELIFNPAGYHNNVVQRATVTLV
jgi:DMSO/TMAO reductase YedYZ molybdopterin-dependent catalytic subunit